MKYTYLGYEVYIKEPVGVYLNMCKDLKKVNENITQKLNNTVLYNGENHFETLVSIVLSSVSEGVTIVVNSLNRLGWNVSEEEFVTAEAECFSIIISVLEKYENDYYNIVQEIAGMEAYRNIRQATRGRFMGGGQDISGMITGALTAEAANLVVGAGHTVANFIGNVGTRLKVEKKTQNLTKRIREFILKENVIKDTLKNLEVVFLDKCSHPDGGVYLQEYDTNHNEYNVNPDLLNIYDDEKKRKTYFAILESIPYCPVIYKILLMEYGDPKNELKVLARAYDIDIERIKKDLLRKEAAKLAKNNGNIIKQLKELEDRYSYYDAQLEKEIQKKYLDNFIDNNTVDYLSQQEVAERISFLNDFSKKYQYNVDMHLKNIKESVIKANNIDLSSESTLQGLKALEEKIVNLSATYELKFNEYLATVKNMISKANAELEKEEIEKRTVYDVSDITMNQGIIKKRRVVLDSVEEAQNVQNRIDEICSFFDAMNFEIRNSVLFEQFSNVQEIASGFPYCEEVIKLVKTKQSQLALEEDNKADTLSVCDEVKDEPESTCPGCGSEIKEGYKFCPKCGNQLVVEIKPEEKEIVVNHEEQKNTDNNTAPIDSDSKVDTEEKWFRAQEIIDYSKAGAFKAEGCEKSFRMLCSCLNTNETVSTILERLNNRAKNHSEYATQTVNRNLLDRITMGPVSRYMTPGEKALFYKDSALIFYGKDGILITDKAIYRIKKTVVKKVLISELEVINCLDILMGSNDCRWCFNRNRDIDLDAISADSTQSGIIMTLVVLLYADAVPGKKIKFFNYI